MTISDEEQDLIHIMHLELVGLMMDLEEVNNLLLVSKQLPKSFFTIYIHSIGQWYEWTKTRPKIIATFDNWADCWGYNDLHFLRDTFILTSEQEAILEKFEAWAMSIKIKWEGNNG